MQDQTSTDRTGSLWLPILISVLIALFLMTLMPTTQFWDRDEAFYARAAVEMTQSGNWILPTYNDAVFPDKPPLIYWLMATFMKIFGENEFGARFASAPATAISAFFVFLIGNRLFNRRVALWSMVAFASSTLTIYLGITAMLDAVLIACICFTLWVFLTVLQNPDRFWLKAVAFAIGVGLAMLTKGPVGPAVVVPCVAITWLCLKPGSRPPFWRMVVLALATFVGVAMFLVWAIPANNMSQGEMLSSGVGEHIIGRALHPMQDHGGSGLWGYLATVPAYVPVVLIGFMPATLFLPAALSVAFRKASGLERMPRLFLLTWAVPAFVMFSLAATKLPHYVAPLFPALALAVGVVVGEVSQAGKLSQTIGRWLYIVMIAGLAAALAAAVTIAGSALVIAALVFAIAVVLIFGFAISVQHRKGRYGSAMMLALVSVVLLLEPMFLVVIPKMETTIKISRPIAASIRKNFKPGTPVFDADYLEPSLVFYLGWPVDSPIRDIAMTPDGVKAFLSTPGEQVIVATQANYDILTAADAQHRLEQVDSFSAWNTNVNSKFQVVVVARLKS